MVVKRTLREYFVSQLCSDDFLEIFTSHFDLNLSKEVVCRAFDKAVSFPKSDFGDLTINAFTLINLLPNLKSIFPMDKISKFVEDFSNFLSSAHLTVVERVEQVSPYINLFLNPVEILKLAFSNFWEDVDISSKRDYKILIEHTSINPSGPVNVARIRNSFIGDTLVRVYRALGFDVDVHYYVNDVGKQVAILTVAKDKKVPSDMNLVEKFFKYKDRPDFQTFFVYVPANKLYLEDESFKRDVETLLKKCELGDKSSLEKLKKTANFCLKGQVDSLKRVRVYFDSFDFESQFLESGKVREIIEKLKSLPEYSTFNGNHVLDLAKFGIKSRFGGVVFERANGTSVYLTRDIAYHMFKKKLADKLINVLGEDHKAEFKTLKTILKILGVIEDSDLEVVHFAFVNFSGRKISTRRGSIIPLDEIIDEGFDKVVKLLDSRGSFNDEQKSHIAESVATSAIRYFELKIAPLKQINFDWDSALNFDGQTAPYIQYSLVRAKKIIKNAESLVDVNYLDSSSFSSQVLSFEEKELLKKLLDFRKVVEDTAYKKAPHILALYAYELANLFSKFYENRPVVDGSSVVVERFVLVVLFRNVMRKLFDLLGLVELDEM